MKKLFLLSIIAIFAIGNVNAQQVKFGAKAGVNFASVSGDDADDIDGKTSFHVGGVANIGISDKLAIQPEVVYSSQGFTSNEDGSDVEGTLNYINIPVLIDFEIAQGLSLQAGPQVGINIKKELDIDGQVFDLDAEDFDYGAALGLEYQMESGLFFQARYTLGFADFLKDSDAKNNVLSFSLGYFFL